MPIDRNEFNDGIGRDIARFLKTFKDNPNKAFTLDELEEKWKIHVFAAISILLYLEQKELIKKKLIGAEFYYILAKP